MGGRGASGAVSTSQRAEWVKAAEGYQEWQAFRYNRPRDSAPDYLDAKVKQFNDLAHKLMKSATQKSDYLEFNENSNKAYYSHAIPGEGKNYAVSVEPHAGGGDGIKAGVVIVKATIGRGFHPKTEVYKGFQLPSEAVKYANKIIKERRKHDKL